MSTSIAVKTDGSIQFVYDDDVFFALRNEGVTEIKRASHVEPAYDKWWQVDMTPSGGPVFQPLFLSRAVALRAEERYLTSSMAGTAFDPASGMVIYALLRGDGSVGYVGKSKHMSDRFKTHVKEKGWPIAYVILAYIKGRKRKTTWSAHERYWIARLKRCYNLENKTPGGNGSFGNPSAETRKKIGDAHRGKPKPSSVELARKMGREHGGGKHNVPHTEEAKRKMSVARKGKYTGPRPPEVGEKISKAQRGIPNPPGQNEQISATVKRRWAEGAYANSRRWKKEEE